MMKSTRSGGGLLTLFLLLCGRFKTSDSIPHCIGNQAWPPMGLKESSSCVLHAFPDKKEMVGINGNGIWDSCIFYKEKGLRSGARDPETNNFALLDHLDLGSHKINTPANPSTLDPRNMRKFERATSYVYNDNFPQAFLPHTLKNVVDPEYLLPNLSPGKPRHPVEGAPNPYFVEVSGISLKGELLHNWLHFRVFMNHSVGDIRENLHTKNERRHYATGKITAMLMMIKDQDGYPIGDFSQEMPCSKTCSKYPHDVFYGDHRNAVPCSYTPPRATSHPGMFLFDADPGYYKKPTEPDDVAYWKAGVFQNTDPQRLNKTLRVKNPVREVHATWSFNQDTCNFVTEIHIYTMIFEEIFEESQLCTDYPVPPATTPPEDCRYYAWAAVYNILYPKGKDSLGAADYVNINYWKERDKRTNEIDCHVPLFDAPNYWKDAPFTKGPVPLNKLDGQGFKTEFVKVPHKYHHLARLDYDILGEPNTYKEMSLEYLGQYTQSSAPICRSPALLNPTPESERNLKTLTDRGKSGTPLVTTFINDNAGIQCPCPAVASPEPLEKRTADPARLHGRLIHASHMGLAYMFLVPLACFVARYYKETFITVFCFQEYWWFMWHVVLLITACGFVMGAILSLYRGERQEIAVSTNLLIHKILGYFSITVFYIEIFTGFFRRSDPAKRMKQILGHWFVGNFNIACAVGSMFAMAFVKQSGMTCNVVYTLCVWTVFVTVWFVLMDIHMKGADKKLDLVPPRTYLPPPVVRLFNRDAPGRNFRMMMLGMYVLNLGLIQMMVSYFIWRSLDDLNDKGDKEESCYFYWVNRRGQADIISADDLGDANDDNLGDY